MTGNAKDTAPATPAAAIASGPSDDQVRDFLGRHPDFLTRNPELLERLSVPSRWSGDGVVDMQQFVLEHLRGEIDSLRDCAQDVIETSRTNMSTQTRTHAAVLAMLGARDFDHMVRTVNEDLPLLLDVDVVSLGFESPAPGGVPMAAFQSAEIRRFAPGLVDGLMGADHDVVLMREMHDDGTVFGGGAGLVRSAALSRLRAGDGIPQGLLAMGSRGAGFHPGQGTDLIVFLSRALERCLARWLEPAE